jgi:hypothetical protein
VGEFSTGGKTHAHKLEDLKAEMMAQAEEAIDNLLAGVSEKENLKLSDIEQLVRMAGQRVV